MSTGGPPRRPSPRPAPLPDTGNPFEQHAENFDESESFKPIELPPHLLPQPKAPKPESPRPSKTSGVNGSLILVSVLYALLGLGTAVGLVLFIFVFLSAKSAPQEAAIAAAFAAWFVGTYVVVRSAEKFVEHTR